jgi:hypothetical protein
MFNIRICRKESTRKKNTKGNNEGKGEVYNASELGSFGLVLLLRGRQHQRMRHSPSQVATPVILTPRRKLGDNYKNMPKGIYPEEEHEGE